MGMNIFVSGQKVDFSQKSRQDIHLYASGIYKLATSFGSKIEGKREEVLQSIRQSSIAQNRAQASDKTIFRFEKKNLKLLTICF